MHALNHLANTSLDACLITKVGDILTTLTNDQSHQLPSRRQWLGG
jgi:hypothetical protein